MKTKMMRNTSWHHAKRRRRRRHENEQDDEEEIEDADDCDNLHIENNVNTILVHGDGDDDEYLPDF